MILLIELPSGTKMVLPQTPESFAFLSTVQLVQVGGYPERVTPARDGLEIKIVRDDYIAAADELAAAKETIRELRKQLEAPTQVPKSAGPQESGE